MKASELKPGNLFRVQMASGPADCIMLTREWVQMIDEPLTARQTGTVVFPFESVELLEENAGIVTPFAADYLQNLRFCCMGYEMKTDSERAAYHHYSGLVGAGYDGLPMTLQMHLYGFR